MMLRGIGMTLKCCGGGKPKALDSAAELANIVDYRSYRSIEINSYSLLLGVDNQNISNRGRSSRYSCKNFADKNSACARRDHSNCARRPLL